MYFPRLALLPSPILTSPPRETASGHGLAGSSSRTCPLLSLLGTAPAVCALNHAALAGCGGCVGKEQHRNNVSSASELF